MPTPSLILVPARFKTGKLYTPFATTSGGTVLGASGDFNVTRATTATRVNASGLIESVASGIPRLDYFASGGLVGCPALLVEPSAQNLAFNSADFTVLGTWASGANTISANVTATLDPAGTNTADKIIPTAVSTTHFISSTQSIAFTSGTTYTLSVFAKAGGYDFLRIAFSVEIMPSLNRGASFNLTSGTVGDTQSGVTARIENYGNGWYRCSISRAATVSTTPSNPFFFNSQNSDSAVSVTFTGDGTSGAFIWGAQVETGSVATSYIPTTTAAITRNADVISVSGAVSGSIGQQSGTIYIECQSEFATNDIIVINTAGQSPGNNYVAITKTATNVFRLSLIASGTTILIDQTSAITSFAKIAVAYASGNTALFINGTQIGSTDTTGFSFNAALNNITFISNMVSGTKTTRIRAVALYTERLTNAQLAALTT